MMIFLSILGILLSILLKILVITARLSLNMVVASAEVAARTVEKTTAKAKVNPNIQKLVKTARRVSLGILKFVSNTIDFMLSLLLMGWVGLVVMSLLIVGILGGGWFVLNNLPGGNTGSTSTDSAVISIVNPPNSQGIQPPAGVPADLTGKNLPAVAATPQQLPAAIIANSAWAMKNRPQGCYHYQQGNTNYCNYDCSTWTASLMEMAGWTVKSNTRLVKTSGPRYIISKNRKSDLDNYYTTSMMRSWNMPGVNKGTVRDASTLKPGDLLLTSGHVAIYVGKNSKGKHVISHAGHVGAKTYTDFEMTQPAGDVGFAPFYTNNWTVFRFSDYTGS